jgi:electron transfer flavoprotein-quinone oxidoreductase
MEKYDVAIVGGGSAGLAALKQLSTLGKQAVLLEAGEKVGVKNISGGILYSKKPNKGEVYNEKLHSIFFTQLQKTKFFPWI